MNASTVFAVIYSPLRGPRTIVTLRRELDAALQFAEEWWRQHGAAVTPPERGRLTVQRCIDDIVQQIADFDDAGWRAPVIRGYWRQYEVDLQQLDLPGSDDSESGGAGQS